MKNLKKNVTLGLTVVLMFGCASREEKAKAYFDNSKADSITNNSSGYIPSSASVVSKDTARKFIRTADLKFKVADVRAATFKIEDAVTAFDGFVTYTNLTSTIERRTVIPVSNDSSLESTYYTVMNKMVIRVSNTKLDTSLKVIARLMDYLDYRIIKADDVTLSLLINKMAEKRLNTHEERLIHAIDYRGKKLNETSTAEENLLNKQLLSDNARITDMNIKDQVSFSTINLTIYQRMSVKRELIENDKNIEAYKPDFLHRIIESIKTGWIVFEYIILFFAEMWGVILLVFAGIYIYRRFFQKKNKV
jgi:hypothetical protein